VSDFRHDWRAALTSESSPASSTQRLVGLILADFANRENAYAWPSIATIARRAGLGLRAVQIALHELVDLRLLVVARAGRGTSVTYQLTIPDLGTSCTPTSARGADPPRHLTTQTSAPGAQTSARRAPELRRSGMNLGEPPTSLRPEGFASPADAWTCVSDGLVFVGLDAYLDHRAEEHREYDEPIDRCPFCRREFWVDEPDLLERNVRPIHVEQWHADVIASAVAGLASLAPGFVFDDHGDKSVGCWGCSRDLVLYTTGDGDFRCGACLALRTAERDAAATSSDGPKKAEVLPVDDLDDWRKQLTDDQLDAEGATELERGEDAS
jgi:hypothetical protein